MILKSYKHNITAKDSSMNIHIPEKVSIQGALLHLEIFDLSFYSPSPGHHPADNVSV